MYPAEIVNPMKAELVDAGFSELLDSAAVDAALAEEGTSVVVLNSVCGCAAASIGADCITAASEPICSAFASSAWMLVPVDEAPLSSLRALRMAA